MSPGTAKDAWENTTTRPQSAYEGYSMPDLGGSECTAETENDRREETREHVRNMDVPGIHPLAITVL